MFKNSGNHMIRCPHLIIWSKSSKLVNEFGGYVKMSGRYNFDDASDLPTKLAHLNPYFLILTH